MLKQFTRFIRFRPRSFTEALLGTEVRTHKMGFYNKKINFLSPYSKANSLVVSCRNYAKNRDIRKEKKKKVKIDENELQEYFDLQQLLADLEKPIEVYKDELVKHTTIRSAAGAIENFKVDFEGDMYTIQDLANIGKKNPRLYVLDFSSFPSVIPTVMNTLQNSEMNLNVQLEGTKVIVPVPKVTKEHREVLAKKSKLYFVKCKEAIRDAQMKYIKKLSRIDKLSIEKKFWLTDQLTAMGDRQIALAEDILKAKQDELLKDEEVIHS